MGDQKNSVRDMKQKLQDATLQLAGQEANISKLKYDEALEALQRFKPGSKAYLRAEKELIALRKQVDSAWQRFGFPVSEDNWLPISKVFYCTQCKQPLYAL